MPLDSNLFTLYLLPRPDQPSLSDLYSQLPSKSSTGHRPIPNYTTSRWIRNATYQTSLLDGVTGDDLGTIVAPSSNDKTKTIHLHNPDATVEVQDRRLGGTISLPLWKHEWHFEWQQQRFQIIRESTSGRASCFDVEIIRKPDPPIKVAMYRPEGASAASLQMMDYNIDRIESITDKRGLEHVLVLAITSCLDAQYDEKHKDMQENIFLNPIAAYHTDIPPNEVHVLPQFHPNQVVEHCLRLFKVDDAAEEVKEADSSTSHLRSAVKNQGCDLVVLKADGQEMQQRALSIAERTKVGFYRLDQRYKGTADELYQYVTMGGQASQESQPKTDGASTTSTPPQSNGQKASHTSSSRPRIKLGTSHTSGTSSPTHSPAASSADTVASSMTIYLSKYRLEDLEAEQAAKARSRMDEQSRLLAERLASEDGVQVQPPRPLSSPSASGPPTSRPLRQRMGFWKG